jgi:phosphoribosylformylglycinamidine (FGAM) synthase PurS component
MIYQIEVTNKKGFRDSHGEHVKSDILDIGLKNVQKVVYCPVYKFDGDITFGEVELIAKNILIDVITQGYQIEHGENSGEKNGKQLQGIIVWLKHGVTDTVSDSIIKAVKDTGIAKKFVVHTGHKYVFEGKISESLLKTVAERLLANPIIQRYELI